MLCMRMGSNVVERSCAVTVQEKPPVRKRREQGGSTTRLHVCLSPEVKAAAEAHGQKPDVEGGAPHVSAGMFAEVTVE